jgi:hypothetical protein
MSKPKKTSSRYLIGAMIKPGHERGGFSKRIGPGKNNSPSLRRPRVSRVRVEPVAELGVAPNGPACGLRQRPYPLP